MFTLLELYQGRSKELRVQGGGAFEIFIRFSVDALRLIFKVKAVAACLCFVVAHVVATIA